MLIPFLSLKAIFFTIYVQFERVIRILKVMSTRKRVGGDARDGSIILEDGHGTGSPRIEEISDMKGDEWNIAILFFLYVLQGIPLGLSSAIPMYLQNRGVSYRQQVSSYFGLNNHYVNHLTPLKLK
jgi:hypothetical protein